ncbi:MAG TPA: epoxyqueuosine reductase [Methylomusa anaerophila]|uniref:Epoxyqueuosine reductase n=1 Tax=Methylomusa anaerophila TaxID=1930071 RepID=A0A348AIU1_9FIRM|nr:epoxyqueuosine reductase [Methylomusa anaerophila]BBB90989.1 epoxyqueuosine reductase [Methylomusa anaerophila]HML88861.1 epoxyqueuosine reductase [Methylomusa anaerophila]
MKDISSDEIKCRTKNLGADLCGIASVERFADAPSGFHPTDVVAGCKSVIVITARFPVSTLSASSQAAYTFVRNRMVDKVDSITFQVAAELESLGSCAVPVPSADPYDYWDDSRRHGQGIISLKHAAVRAGLGRMGKNTLLVNDELGNMLWLGAILIDKDIEPDPIADYQTCMPDCRICLDSCPAKALDGTTIEQGKCRGVSAKYTEGGGGVYACNLCRKVCPQHSGLKKDAMEG